MLITVFKALFRLADRKIYIKITVATLVLFDFVNKTLHPAL